MSRVIGLTEAGRRPVAHPRCVPAWQPGRSRGAKNVASYTTQVPLGERLALVGVPRRQWNGDVRPDHLPRRRLSNFGPTLYRPILPIHDVSYEGIDLVVPQRTAEALRPRRHPLRIVGACARDRAPRADRRPNVILHGAGEPDGSQPAPVE